MYVQKRDNFFTNLGNCRLSLNNNSYMYTYMYKLENFIVNMHIQTIVKKDNYIINTPVQKGKLYNIPVRSRTMHTCI